MNTRNCKMKLFTFIFSLLVISGIDPVSAQSMVTKDSTLVSRDSATVSIKSDKMPYISHFNSWDIGVHIGLTYPNTDIAASTITSSNVKHELAFGLDVTKFLTHSFAFQGRFMMGQMSGVDGNKPQYRYNTDVHYDITLNAYFQLGNVAFLKRTPNLAIYGAVGAGVINYTPHVYLDGGKDELTGIYSQYQQAYDTVDYSNTSELIIPFSVGVKYRIAKQFSLNAEYSLRTTNSDRMDGWYKLLSEDDDYSYLSLGLTYHIGRKEHVAEWYNPLYNMYADLYDMKDKMDLMTKDGDKDGVADYFDREPETPVGFKVYGDGTSIDSDGDGVPDFNDAEPFSPKLAVVDASGREIDSDGDGVPDARDMEPNTPKGALVATGGQTIQNGPGVAKGGGSSIMASSGYLPSIFFALDSYEIQKKYDETLASIALVMKKNPDLKFILTGNCDVRASVEYNTKLGLKRAEAVKKHLVKRYNIDASRLSTTTLGKTDPITGTQPMNRRVDLAVDDK